MKTKNLVLAALLVASVALAAAPSASAATTITHPPAGGGCNQGETPVECTARVTGNFGGAVVAAARQFCRDVVGWPC